MNNDITQLLVVALAIVPFVNAVVGMVKKSFPTLQSNFVPVISVAVGLALGALFSFLPDVHYTIVQMVIAGAIAGMASCGVYEIAKSPDVTNTAPALISVGTTVTEKVDKAVSETPTPAAPVVSAASPVTPLSGAAAQTNVVDPNVSK